MDHIPTKIFSIQGNIGSGKSTVVRELEARHIPNMRCLQEPVNVWSQYQQDGKNILEHFYQDRQRYAFPFQMMAFYTRLKVIKGLLSETDKKDFIVMERSLETDKRIFAEMLIDDGSIDKMSARIYHEWFNDLTPDYTSGIVNIYIRTPPEVCHQRIAQRKRPGEDIIPLDYLQRCHELHDKWLLHAPGVHVIDGTLPVVNINNQILSVVLA